MESSQQSSPFSSSNDTQSFEQLVSAARSEQLPEPATNVPPTTDHSSVKYAGFWVRFAASMIDGLVLMIPSMALSAGIASLMATGSVGMDGMVRTSAMNSVFNLLLAWAYSIAMLSKYQATLGKRAMGLIVISDTSDHLAFGQIVLRETLGKFLSSVSIGIGYIMAGFTTRKQSLHDKIAGTLVIHKDPNAKTKTGIIAGIVIAIIAVPLAIMGILAAVSLFSLGSAREKAQDASIKSNLSGEVPSMVMYQDENETFDGFELSAAESFPACSGKPIVNIAEDGLSMAIFAKLCVEKDTYYCVDSVFSSGVTVNSAYALSGASACSASVGVTKPAHEKRAVAIPADQSSTSRVVSALADGNTENEGYDSVIDDSVRGVASEIDAYKAKNVSYNGYVMSVYTKENAAIDKPSCVSDIKVDISPSGNEYVVHQASCVDAAQSFCMENGMTQVKTTSTASILKTYQCD